MTHADDATLAALRRYEQEGSDLSKPMEIDFFVAVPTESAGLEVARRVRPHGFRPSVEQDRETGVWTCYCAITVVPRYEAVVAIEKMLDAIAREVGGHADGFGSYGNAPESH
jgi:hypothetical protein